MKVSVIIPVYNTEKYLKRCFDSVLNQTLDDFEIIVVDDGSNDNSWNIISDYSERYENFYSIQQSNSGQSVARNRGLEIAQGQYVAFIDSDDFIHSEMLKTMYENGIGNNSELINCRLAFYHEDEGKTKVYGKPFNDFLIEGEDILKDVFYGKNIYSSVVNKLYKRSLFQEYKLNFPEGLFYEDILFAKKVSYFAKRATFINEVFYTALVRAGSTTRKMSIINLKNGLEILKEEKSFLQTVGIWDRYKDDYKAGYVKFIMFLLVQALYRSSSIQQWYDDIEKSMFNEYLGIAFKKNSIKQKILIVLYKLHLLRYLKLLRFKIY